MEQRTTRDKSAMTLNETLVVIVVLWLLALLILTSFAKKPHQISGGSCINNLHQIGLAYRVWEGDNRDLLPFQVPVAEGGWADSLTNANQGAICWTNYAIMANDLGQTPKLLICPRDERRPATDFATNLNDTHLSYFVGVGANASDPRAILGGDRNLGLGTKPDPNYGLSPISGKGLDVAIPISGPLSWSLKIHSAGNPAGLGDLLLADGSQQKADSAGFNQTYLSNSVPTTNWPAGHAPATPSIRLIFP
jgi:hypothetical protein